MKRIYTCLLLPALAAVCLMSSCHSASEAPDEPVSQQPPAVPQPEKKPEPAPFTEKQIGETKYTIAVPANYTIAVTKGPGFSVYYISPSDTTVKNAWTCGLYLGGHPHEFAPSDVNCTTDTLQGALLEQHPVWKVFHCGDQYTLQTIVQNKSGSVHAFGHTQDKDDLRQILQAFASLRKH